MKPLLLTFIMGLLFAACGQRSPLSVTTKDRDLFALETDFSAVKKNIFAPRCVSCHAQYASYEGVKADLDKILTEVEENRMPKNSPLSDAQKTFLRKWIDAGALAGGSVETEDPTAIAWKRVSREILGPKCIQCHNPEGQAKFLDLSSRSVIWAERKKLLNFEAPEESYLMTVITDPKEPMPPVYSNLERLNANEVELIKTWIELGIP